MPFKVNIGEKKGHTFRLETEAEALIGRKIGEKINGDEIKPELSGYELEIMGTSDMAGFPGFKEVEGTSLKRIILTYGKGMKTRKPHGLRLKKTVHGNTISKDTSQINLKVVKEGGKKLEEIFPEQIKAKEEKKTEQVGVAASAEEAKK
jgi:small subunit ribosomal protein S6e